MDYTLHHGDCLDVLRTMADNSVDAVVTDPPYGLAFMGKRWDYDVPSVEIWAECLRVLKPGGHLLAFAGTRTQHRMAVRIEDAGFEIRDMIAWVYGSGFPKSLDVSKAIDKAAGAEREVVGQRTTGIGTGEGSTPIMGDGNRDITAPATPEAQQWSGWGTALKPALEPITMARKPLAGTVAANVLEHGTGAINIDGCRVEGAIGPTYQTGGNGKVGSGGVYEGGYRGEWSSADPHPESVRHHASGRWPANLIHDGSEEVMGLFPQTAASKSGGKAGWQDQYVGGTYKPIERTGYDEAPGSAARFFYCAKASKADRGEGNTHPTVKPTGLMRYLCRLVTPPGGIVLDPFMGSGSTGKAAILEGFQFIGIERDAEYLAIAEARISYASGLSQPPQRPTRQPAPASPGQLALF
jgi:site-specific DNA-methyltransferase (adenine-specific)